MTVHIRNIREKIEINPKEPKYIKVVYGLGYKCEKFKYSYLGKLLCIILALITGLSAIFLTTAEVLTVINNKVNGNDYSYYTLNHKR